jgi:hypothetical protein
MKELLRLSTAFATLAVCGSAHAGFLDPAPAYPVTPPGYPGYPVKSANTVPSVYDWTGFYVGINGGGSWGHAPWSSDGTIGYNAQNLGRFVVGEEFDFDWRSIDTTFSTPSCEFKSRWVSTAACGLDMHSTASCPM